MTRSLRIADEAEAELEDAADWYDEQRPGLGDDLMEAAEEAVSRIVERPEAGMPVRGLPEGLPLRRVFLRRFRRYSVVYLLTADEIRILAFAHMGREPGYWLDRL